MDDEARVVYEEQIRLIEEDEACAVEAAHLHAALKRNAARRRYIHAREKALQSSSKRLYGPSDAMQSAASNRQAPLIQIVNSSQSNSTSTNSPTFNQNGEGGQYVAEHMYTTPAANQ